AHDDVVCLGGDDAARYGIELQVDRGNEDAVFVAAGDEPSVDLADIGPVGVAADHHVDCFVEFLDDVDDRSGYAGTFIIVAGRKAAFMDQHDDGLDPAGPQLRHQRVDGLRLVLEFQTLNAHRRHEIGRALQRQANEGDGNA